MSALPFPFGSLEALSRFELLAASKLRRVGRTHVRFDGIAAALTELLGERVELFVRRLRPADTARGADDSVGVMLAHADTRDVSRRVLVELEGALAAAVTARALRLRAPRLTDPSKAPAPALAGAVAAVVLAALRRSHANAALRVVAAGPGSALARDLAQADPRVTTAWLTVVVGADAYAARVSIPDDAVASIEPAQPPVDTLAALGTAPLSVPLVVATVLAARSDLDALARGDAFVLPRSALGAPSAGALRGPVALVPPTAERGIGAALAGDGRLVVGGLLESHPWDEVRMPAEPSATATNAVLEDVPIVVRVELGAVQMSAREWAELGAGDVVTLGRKVGDPAMLRVGGVEVARGELVVVEGEYAVRIVARAEAAR